MIDGDGVPPKPPARADDSYHAPKPGRVDYCKPPVLDSSIEEAMLMSAVITCEFWNICASFDGVKARRDIVCLANWHGVRQPDWKVMGAGGYAL